MVIRFASWRPESRGYQIGRLEPHPHALHGTRARRRDGRVGHERRDAASREWLSASPRGARNPGGIRSDGSSLTRTLSMERALDDVMVAWAMNGEMLRPENGYPLRLVAPGIQGVSDRTARASPARSPWNARSTT